MSGSRRYKILLTNRRLDHTGGTESFCRSLSKALSRGHDVYVYSPGHGAISDQISKHAEIVREPAGDFDMILYTHNTTVSPDFIAKCKIYTIHGIYSDLEKPPGSMDAYVAISTEIAGRYEHLKPRLIRSGIDTDEFFPVDRRSLIRTLLYSSNYENDLSSSLKRAAWSLGMRYRRLGGMEAKLDVVDDLQAADVVVGVGRTALEAMSCGKKVVVADRRSYADYGMDGFLNEANVEKVSASNYSGRAFKKPMTFMSLRREIRRAATDSSDWERNWILEHHDIERTAREYIALAEEVIESKV